MKNFIQNVSSSKKLSLCVIKFLFILLFLITTPSFAQKKVFTYSEPLYDTWQYKTTIPSAKFKKDNLCKATITMYDSVSYYAQTNSSNCAIKEIAFFDNDVFLGRDSLDEVIEDSRASILHPYFIAKRFKYISRIEVSFEKIALFTRAQKNEFKCKNKNEKLILIGLASSEVSIDLLDTNEKYTDFFFVKCHEPYSCAKDKYALNEFGCDSLPENAERNIKEGFTCKKGYHFSSDSTACIQKLECDSTQYYNEKLNACENPPEGAFFVNGGPEFACPEGQLFFKTQNRCAPKAKCTAQQYYNELENTCINPPENSHFVNGGPKYTCNSGFIFVEASSTCEIKANCALHETYNEYNNSCAPKNACSAGFVLKKGKCVKQKTPKPQAKNTCDTYHIENLYKDGDYTKSAYIVVRSQKYVGPVGYHLKCGNKQNYGEIIVSDGLKSRQVFDVGNSRCCVKLYASNSCGEMTFCEQ